MSSLMGAVELLRGRGQLPRSGTVSIKELLQRFQPSPPGSMRALLLKMLDQASIFCGTPDPDRDGIIHPLTFGSPGGRWSRTSLSFSINPAGCKGLTPASAAATITQAFGLWRTVVPFLTLQPVRS